MSTVNQKIIVNLGDRSYPVYVGEDMIRDLEQYIPQDVGKVAIVTQESVGILPKLETPSTVMYMESGEHAKSLDTIAMLEIQTGILKTKRLYGMG